MNLLQLIGNDGVVITNENNLSVNEALTLACTTLIDRGSIEQSYLDAIIEKHHEIGPYYVLAPKIAMPHARPEDGVNFPALQLTVFKNGIDFGSTDNGDVFFSITLAAKDSDNHIETIMALSELFQNNDDIEKIINANSIEDIIPILERY